MQPAYQMAGIAQEGGFTGRGLTLRWGCATRAWRVLPKALHLQIKRFVESVPFGAKASFSVSGRLKEKLTTLSLAQL